MRALVVAALGLAACARRVPPPVTPAAVDHAQARWADASVAQLERGRAVLMARCAGCHLTPLPSDLAAAAWPANLDEMAPEANLTGPERVDLERYLVSLAGAAASR
ncbi:MAG: hypothetical protein R2939_17315 [Kofleriaceae bacterium]